MSEQNKVTGVVLAGGLARRMDQQDKGLLLFNQRPLVSYALTAMKPITNEIFISANRNLDTYSALGYQVVTDSDAEDYAGPLAGLQAGLSAARHELVLCVPCDTPHLPNTLALRLVSALGEAPMAVARCTGHPQPTVCLVRSKLLPALSEFLASGERKMGWWQRQNGASYVDFDDASAFANLNTNDDLAL